MALFDWTSFRTQYSVIFSALNALRYVGLVDKAVSLIGSSVLVTGLAWVSTKYVRKFMNREFISTTKKAVLITGTDKGFGHDLAIKMNESGYRVYATLTDIKSPAVEQLMSGSRFETLMSVKEMDVTDETAVNKVAKEIGTELEAKGEQLWAVINAAEVQEFGHFDWSQFEMYEKIFNVNTLGTVRVVRAFLPLLRQSKGRIVNIESIAGRLTIPKLTAYCMSKHANLAFADALRRELYDWGINVSTVELAFDRKAGQLITMDRFVKSMNKNWVITPEHIQNLYGNQYLQEMKIENLAKVFSNDLVQAMDDVLDAVRGQEPLIRYTPYTSLKAKLWSNMAQVLPIEWLDKYYYSMEKDSPKPSNSSDSEQTSAATAVTSSTHPKTQKSKSS